MGAGADACATKGVLGDPGTAGDSERGGMADGLAWVLGFPSAISTPIGRWALFKNRAAKGESRKYGVI